MNMKKMEMISICALLIVLQACSAERANLSGRINSSQEVTWLFETYTVLPDHNYYYSGPDGKPDAIIGIDKQYILDTKLWKPVDLTPEQLKKWMNFILDSIGFVPIKIFGAHILNPSGQRVGVWYSPWAPSTVIMGTDNHISVYPPNIGPGGSMSGWGTDDYK
jgi:hypothetical protein